MLEVKSIDTKTSTILLRKQWRRKVTQTLVRTLFVSKYQALMDLEIMHNQAQEGGQSVALTQEEDGDTLEVEGYRKFIEIRR